MANYLKQGAEEVFITDSAEIGRARLNNLRHTILNYMLGDFDEHGVYTVDPEIRKELISMKKYIANTIDNMEVCQSEVRLFKPITFLVSFDEDCATLSLIEKISHLGNNKGNGGSYSDINEYILDRIETSGVINRQNVFRKWNISDQGGSALDITSLDNETKTQLFGLADRFKYLLYVNAIFLEREKQLEERDLAYSESLKKLISAYPNLNKAVEKTINDKIKDKKKFIRIDKPFVAKTLSEVLEQALDENMSALNPEEVKSFNLQKHEILNISNQQFDEILPIEIAKPNENSENSVGIVRLNTDIAFETRSLNENGEEVVSTFLRDERSIPFEDLKERLSSAQTKADERVRNASAQFVAGRTNSDGKAYSRLSAVYGNLNENIGEETTDIANKLKTEEASASLVAQAGKTAQSNKTAQGNRTATRTAGGGGVSAGGGGGRSAGGGGGGSRSSGGGSGRSANRTNNATNTGTKSDKKDSKKDDAQVLRSIRYRYNGVGQTAQPQPQSTQPQTQQEPKKSAQSILDNYMKLADKQTNDVKTILNNNDQEEGVSPQSVLRKNLGRKRRPSVNNVLGENETNNEEAEDGAEDILNSSF